MVISSGISPIGISSLEPNSIGTGACSNQNGIHRIVDFVIEKMKVFYSSTNLDEVEKLRNAALDIGPQQHELLKDGVYPEKLLAFSASMFFKSIRQQIETNKSKLPSVEKITAEEIANIPKLLHSNSFFNKIIQLLIGQPICFLEKLEPLNAHDINSMRKVSAKYPQCSGSCSLKNLNSLLANELSINSASFVGGFKGHVVYAEVVRGEKGHYFGLVHNLGSSSKMHELSTDRKILPYPLHFEDINKLKKFIEDFRNPQAVVSEYQLTLASASLKNPNAFESKSTNYKIADTLTARNSIPLKRDTYTSYRDCQKKLLEQLAHTLGSNNSGIVAEAKLARKGFKSDHINLSQAEANQKRVTEQLLNSNTKRARI